MKESGENYLVAIYSLGMDGAEVHAVDVAKSLGYTKPSVSRAMGLLKDAGMIEVSKNGSLTLTKEGIKSAKNLYAKQETIAKFLMLTADIDGDTAFSEAVKMSHFMQDKTYKGICSFIKAVES